jgi:hypothetical protein
MKKNLLAVIAAALFAVSIAGCTYTTQTALPDHVKSIHVAKVVNKIDITAAVSSDKPFQIYRPGLEVDVRNALIERFIFDGHLKVASESAADAILYVELLSFDRDPVRFNSDDSIQEFRVHIKISARLMDKSTNLPLWQTSAASGNAEYFLSGEHARSEDESVAEALKDLVRQIVENVLETW